LGLDVRVPRKTPNGATNRTPVNDGRRLEVVNDVIPFS
jgi:hypothetical protein